MKTVEHEYKCAYKEVYIIIENLEEDIRGKIPKEKIEFYKNQMDIEYEFKLDLDKDLSEQNLLYQTRCILANLFRDYIATEEDRAEILKEEKEELKQIEHAKIEKYNPDDIFKSTIKTPKIQIEEVEITDLIIHDENTSLFEFIKNKIIELTSKFLRK